MRDPKKYTIEELLKNEEQFMVPKYQRGYDWKGDTQVKDLFMDIFSCIDSKHAPDLFLGTMIFDVSKEKQLISEVIDGQQRLTTLIIVLIACRNFSRHVLTNEKLAV